MKRAKLLVSERGNGAIRPNWRQEKYRVVSILIFFSTNDAVLWLTLLLRIRKIPASNLGPEIDCSGFIVAFLSPSRQVPG
jgi:hypothetical protein